MIKESANKKMLREGKQKGETEIKLKTEWMLITVKDQSFWTSTAQKMKFSIRFSLGNMTKSAGNCKFSHIY